MSRDRRHDRPPVSVRAFPKLLARPPGALLIPSGFVALFPLATQFEPGTVALVPDILFAVAWPLVLTATGWSVWWTYTARPQHPRTERYILQLTFCIMFGWITVVFGVVETPLLTSWQMGALTGFCLWVYHLPEVQHRLETRYETRRATTLVTVYFALPLIVYGMFLEGTQRGNGTAFLVLSALSLLLGLLAMGVPALAERARED